MMSLHLLGKETVHLLSSSQVITSVYSVVKELVENSLDAKATSIEVKLENFGLNLIEVRDNGAGIKREDTSNMAKPHFTSKLTTFHDLQSLEQYGFRGEALSSVAAVSNMSVTTRTNDDIIATTYTLDHAGNITSTKHSHLGTGTTVSVTGIFRNLPVRRQCFNSAKKCKEELRRIEELLIGFGLTHCALRLSLKHNKCVIWQKIQTGDFRSNVSLIFSAALFQQLVPLNYQCFSPMVKIRSFVPRVEADLSMVSRSTPDKIYVLVNERSVLLKPLIQLLKQAFSEAFPSQSGRYPIAVVTISVPPADIDVNLEPNKTSVLLHNMDFILTTLESLLNKMYAPSKLSTADKEAAVTTGGSSRDREDIASTAAQTSNNQSPDTNQTKDIILLSEVRQQRTTESRGMEDIEGSEQNVRALSSNSEAPPSTRLAPPIDREAPPTGSMDFIFGDRPYIPSFPHRSSRDQLSDERVGTEHALNDVVADSGSPWRGQRSPSIENEDSHLISRQELESFELLDISEFENDSSDSLLEGALQAPPLTTLPVAQSTLSTPARETGGGFAPFNQMSLSQWSRGEGLRDSTGQAIEPVKILPSAGHGQTARQDLATNSHTPITARETSSQSKLTYKGPSPIFDMIHSKPVKRKADSPLSGNLQQEGGTTAKKHRPLPTLLQSLIHGQNSSDTTSADDNVEVHADVPSQSVSFDFESIFERSNTNCSTLIQDHVIGYVNPPGVWLVLISGSIACFNTNTSSHSNSLPLLPNLPGPTDRREVELLFHSRLTRSSSRHEDNNHYFHKIIKL